VEKPRLQICDTAFGEYKAYLDFSAIDEITGKTYRNECVLFGISYYFTPIISCHHNHILVINLKTNNY
jgi:hypothetical protein